MRSIDTPFMGDPFRVCWNTPAQFAEHSTQCQTVVSAFAPAAAVDAFGFIGTVSGYREHKTYRWR